jgi:tetrapyrrole methylase family protein/MazG family protein
VRAERLPAGVVERVARVVPGRVVVVGLGPAGADYLLPAARRALESAQRRFVRTRRHPAVADLEAEGMQLASFDHVYESSPDLDSAYREMVDVLLAAAAVDEVVYGVPGSPAIAERTVELLRERTSREAIGLRVLPGLSFADLAWTRLGLDPMATRARVVNARAIDEAELAGPMLIAQCDHPLVLSDVKLTLLEHLAPDTPITVLQRLGLADERVERVPLVELDRAVEPDHLTSLFVEVDPGAADAAQEVARLLQLAKRLRDPEGCPWDAEQTHRSLTRYLLEESYEVVEVVDALPDPAAYTALADELGDLLYQVVFHATIAAETDEFTMADVARGIHDKLVRRHPHVFGDVVADASADVVRNWEQIKKGEKGSTSIVEGIPAGLPSLLYTHKLFSKAASLGLDPGSVDEGLDRADTALGHLRAGDSDFEHDLAQLLAAAVVVARAGGIDAESALRGWAARYRRRFEAMERLAIDRDVDLAALDEAGVAALWLEAAGLT